MIEIVDRTIEVSKYDTKVRARRLRDVNTMAVHRIGPVLGEVNVYGAEDIAALYCQHPDWGTDEQMPYSFVIREDGVCEQALRLSDAGPHAFKWNGRAFGVALIGDFRKTAPNEAQLDALADLGALWVQHYWASQGFQPIPLLVRGHDELPGGSKYKNKDCPGKKLSMTDLRAEISERLEEEIWNAGVLL